MSAAGHIVYAGVQLPATLVALEAQHHPASSAAEARRMAARALAIRALLVREARREASFWPSALSLIAVARPIARRSTGPIRNCS